MVNNKFPDTKNSAARLQEVAVKYESIYSFLYQVMMQALNTKDVDESQKYSFLKNIMAPAWEVASQIGQAEKIGWADLQRRCEEINNRKADLIVEGQRYTGTMRECRRTQDRLYAEKIAEHVSGADVVVELGCGWGHRLCDLWEVTGNPSISYVALDRQMFALNCVKALSRSFKRMNLKSAQFDFLEPKFEKIDARKIAIITVHAIEQVQYIGRKWLDTLFSQNSNIEIVGIHLEPIRQQLNSDFALDKRYAEKRHYNLDLFEVLSAHPEIVIDMSEAQIFDRRIGNSISMVTWSRTSG